MSNFASEGWRIVEIIVTVSPLVRGAPGLEDWKKPFKELKLSAVRAEREWAILLKVEEKEIPEIYALIDGRFHVETVLEECAEETKTWEETVGPTAAEA